MRSGMRSLEGRTALVTGGGKGLGRAISLALSARGVRIVISGSDERALGETVGEIAHGGGKARHVAGAASDPKLVGAAVDRAVEVFGALDIVVHAEPTDAAGTFALAVPRLGATARLLVAALAGAEPGLAGVVREQAEALRAKGITCNAVVLEGALTDDAVDDAAMDVAELVIFLCGRAADGITGQAIAIRAVT